MTIDSSPQPCPRCLRPTVLVTNRLGREWQHVGTWRTQCGPVVRSVCRSGRGDQLPDSDSRNDKTDMVCID